MDKLEEAMQRAAQIAKAVPDNLQEAAFNRALDALLGGEQTKEHREQKATHTKPKNGKRVATNLDSDRGKALGEINRTQYPDVGATKRVADRALKVLQLALDDLGIDGLSASEIADVLSLRFRLPVKKNAVHMALTRETETVDFSTNAEGAIIFRIMEPGESYLERLRAGELNKGAKSGSSSKPRKKKASARNTGPTTAGNAKEKPSAAKKATGRSGSGKGSPGVGAALEQLFGNGFFDKARTIGAVVGQIDHDLGRSFKSNELSPVLLRWLRSGKVKRQKNADGQYEYSKR
jgi:hypothetical protein